MDLCIKLLIIFDRTKEMYASQKWPPKPGLRQWDSLRMNFSKYEGGRFFSISLDKLNLMRFFPQENITFLFS